MKLVELRCKNCGSSLEVSENEKEIVCRYCNTTFRMDDEVQHVKYDDMEQAGYDFEKGKIRAQQEQAGNNYSNQTSNGSYQPCCNEPLGDFLIVFFLGTLGVHKFMKNQIGMGILYLFTGGLFGIGWLIDLIKSITYLSNSKNKE